MVLSTKLPPASLSNRISVSAVFFMHGLCFASWASRIPGIQESLKLSESALGSILFALPTGFFLSLPFAGWLVGKLGSRIMVLISATLYSTSLVAIGASGSILTITISLFFFGFFGNLLNIAVNTQAVTTESLSKKKLMASFHGLWSLAGFTGAAIGTWMAGSSINPFYHFLFIAAVVWIMNATCFQFLVRRDVQSAGKQPLFALPDKALIALGVVAFCSMMAEGTMFDWSGVYFKKVVQVDGSLTGAGYTAFMVAMAGTRFIADGLSSRFGLRRLLQASAILTATGLMLAVIFPYLATSLIGFFLVGMGVSSVVPMVYSAAGKTKTMSPGAALSAVSSIGFLGLLVAPPLIGFIADATSLRISFLVVAFVAMVILVLSTRVKEE